MNEADRATAERHLDIWEQFHRLPVVSAWAGRQELHPAVTASVGFVIPVDDEPVCRQLERVVSRLKATGCVNAFPPDYWHITIVPPTYLTSGESDSPGLLPLSFVQEALAKGREVVRSVDPFEVTVCGLNAFREVLIAVPYDGGRGLELGCRIRSAIPELPERYSEGHDPLPHISLTNYARDDCLEGLVDLVKMERNTDFGSFCVRRLELFVLPWRDGVPGRVEKHVLPLGQS